ncbi:N-acetylmuramoyl-L-alanine amidase [hot springs metagenome]|uniref:N-acetylmuramoyl-L-alanine amidase n=1 Tax=hot springs metagenome TaxID=433727 RepID=A0A5J4L134_9ZZZZ
MVERFTICFSLFIALLTMFLISPVAAQVSNEQTVTIKVGKHSNFIRIVFLGIPDEYIQKASVILADNNVIKVDFRSSVVFKPHNKDILKSEVPLDIVSGIKIGVKGSSCSIIIENLDDINVLKLSAPARLVIDAYINKAIKEEMTVMDASIDGSSIPIETFVIDPGHGGYDSGIRGKNFIEKDFVMAFARDFSHILEKKGKKVFLTRKGDQVLSIKDRIKITNQKSPEIFISLHLSSKNEFVIYTAPKTGDVNQYRKDAASEQENNKNITNAIMSSVRDGLGIGVKNEKLPLSVIAYVNAPAILIELPNPEKFHYDKRNKERLINAILKWLSVKNSKGQVLTGEK